MKNLHGVLPNEQGKDDGGDEENKGDTHVVFFGALLWPHKCFPSLNRIDMQIFYLLQK